MKSLSLRSSRFLKVFGWGALAVVLCSTISCGGDSVETLNPVRGKVLYKGQPLPGAIVAFHPASGPAAGERPTGVANENGEFSMTTGQAEGAPVGQYVVTIICTETPSEAPKGPIKGFSTSGVESRDKLKGAYSQAAASKIKVEVKEGENQLEPFDLK